MILRSTFITGFPGETDEQFEELAEFAAEIKFQRLGCFAYSAEEGTPAASFPDQIDDEIKQHRADIIMEHQQSVMTELRNVSTAEPMPTHLKLTDVYSLPQTAPNHSPAVL